MVNDSPRISIDHHHHSCLSFFFSFSSQLAHWLFFVFEPLRRNANWTCVGAATAARVQGMRGVAVANAEMLEMPRGFCN